MSLISKEYKKQNEILHNSKRGFGASGHRWADIVIKIVNDYQVESMLDYGCGQSTLYKEIDRIDKKLFTDVEYKEYDPCIPFKSICPGNADLVTCTDVLEHIEPNYLDEVLTHLFSLANKVVFLNINTKKANKVLPDGRNAHLIQKKGPWWSKRLKQITDWGQIILPVNNPKNFNIVLIKEEN